MAVAGTVAVVAPVTLAGGAMAAAAPPPPVRAPMIPVPGPVPVPGVAPSQNGSTSTNWSGYALAGQPVTS